MFPWPRLELTEFEKKYVSYYATPGDPSKGIRPKPGVLKRVYRVRLNNLADLPNNIPGPLLTSQIQISRRSRVFGLVFGGDTASWFLNIRTASGEQYIARAPDTPESVLTTNVPGALVSSMVPGTTYDAEATVGEPPALAGPQQTQSQHQYGALLVEPNWQLVPNETLIFEGILAPSVDPQAQRILTIAIHVWEFPGMMNAERTVD